MLIVLLERPMSIHSMTTVESNVFRVILERFWVRFYFPAIALSMFHLVHTPSTSLVGGLSVIQGVWSSVST